MIPFFQSGFENIEKGAENEKNNKVTLELIKQNNSLYNKAPARG